MKENDAQRLLDLIVRCIRDGRFTPGKPRTYLGYKECHDLLNLPRRGNTWGRSLQLQGLNDLADWVERTRVPAITGLIVDTTKGHKPGHGYFTAFNSGTEDCEWWHEQVRRAIAYDWSHYSQAEGLPSRQEIQQIEHLHSEGQKKKIEAQTRQRCEAFVRRAQSVFRSSDGELRCSVCGWVRPSAKLRGEIVEIHHLRPVSALPRLGVKWTFAKAIKLLAPLCPNCHRVAHAKADGDVYTLAELKKIMRSGVNKETRDSQPIAHEGG